MLEPLLIRTALRSRTPPRAQYDSALGQDKSNFKFQVTRHVIESGLFG